MREDKKKNNNGQPSLAGLIAVRAGLILNAAAVLCLLPAFLMETGSAMDAAADTLREGKIFGGGMFSLIVLAAGAAGCILIMIGLSLCLRLSERFRKARLNYAGLTLLWILWIFLLSRGWNALAAVSARGGAMNRKMVLLAALSALVLLLLLIFSVIARRNLMSGCAVTAGKRGNKKVMNRCIRAWMEYLVAALAVIVPLPVIAIKGRSSFIHVLELSGGTIGSLNAFHGQFSGLTFWMLILAAALIFLIAIQIVMIIRVGQTRRVE